MIHLLKVDCTTELHNLPFAYNVELLQPLRIPVVEINDAAASGVMSHLQRKYFYRL